MSDNPTFTAVGDEPLEARIVAWVLGDASAFEATELERLCSERPELVVFRRRMQALHGLLTEAEDAQPDPAWKLPPEKRKALDEIFGTRPKPLPLAGKSTTRPTRNRSRWALYAIAACAVFMFIVIGFSAGSLGMKKSWKGALRSPEIGYHASGTAPEDRVSLQTDYPAELIEGTPKPIHLPGVSGAEPMASRRYAAADSPREIPARPSGPAAASKPATPPASQPGAIAANPAKGETSLTAEPALERAIALGDSLSDAGAFGGGVAGSPKAEDAAVRSDGSAKAGAASLQLAEEESAEGASRMAIADNRLGRPVESQPLATATPAPGGGIGAGAAPQSDDWVRSQLAQHGKLAGEKPAPEGRSDLSSGLRGATRENLRSGDGAITRNSIDAVLEREKARGTEVTGTAAVATDGLADESKKALESSDFGLLEKKANDGSDRGRATATRSPAKPGEPPPPAAPGQPANGGIPALGQLAFGKQVDGGVRGDQAGTDEKVPVLPESKPTEGAAKAPPQPADAEFDMVETLKRRAPGADQGVENGRADLNYYYRNADPASGKDDSTGEDLTIVAGQVIRRSERRLEDLSTPSLQSRPDSSTAWHTQDEATKAKADTNGPATAPADGLKSDRFSTSTLAEREMVRRQAGVAEADRLLQEGRDAYQRGDFEQAETRFKSAEEKLPDASALADRKQAIAEHQALANVAKAKEQVRRGGQGNLDDARALLNKALAVDPNNEAAAKGLAELGSESAQNTDVLRKKLYTAEGAYNLGKYDQAKAEYENVLRTDPYNKDARRGLEQIAAAKSTYYRAAYDQTKAEMLMEVDKAWEMTLPADAAPAKKEPAPVDPGTEIAAAEDPYSTFSLSISDASFKTAQAALAKGEQPDPAGIRIEQFYNAMDYGDPAPASGEPVAAKIEQAAHPVVPGRNLVRVALRTAATGRSAAQPLRLTLLIDQSGSMARDDRRRAMDRALKELATLLTPQDRVTVVGFSLAPRLLADSLPGDQANKLTSMINLDANEGGTNLERALLLGSQLAASRKQAGAQNRLVLFTDGAANLGNADPERLAQTVKEMRQNGLPFDAAGLGTSELNDRLLAELARHGNGRFYVVDAAGDEPQSFAKQLAGAFRPAAENVKVQVRFNPQRVKGYKLVGFEEHRLKQEDFRNDAVDAAELAAEEAGVALYQVQPIPSGSGDLGEVSVRFRDTASGQMVERSWSIPYDPSAPGFDQAPPSLQLAGLAMLSAEKLRGGPMAAAIDFNQFTNPRATIRQTYPQARRVAELLEMIDRLR